MVLRVLAAADLEEDLVGVVVVVDIRTTTTTMMVMVTREKPLKQLTQVIPLTMEIARTLLKENATMRTRKRRKNTREEREKKTIETKNTIRRMVR